MASMNYEVYVALIEAGASQEKASAAAIEIQRIQDSLTNDVLLEIKNELKVCRWLLLSMVTGVGVLVVKAFFGG